MERVLDSLTAAGFVDDAATSGAMARSRAGRGIGKSRIGSVLRNRGLGREDVERALAGIPEAEEKEALGRALAKKDRTLRAGLTAAARSKKLFDHLVRRGFQPSSVLEALRTKGATPDDPD